MLNWYKNLGHGWRLYVLVHSVFAIAVVGLVFAYPQLVTNVLLMVMIVFAMMSLLILVRLLYYKKWGLRLELLRIFAVLLLTILVGFKISPGFLFGYLTLIIVTCSLAVLLKELIYRVLARVYEF